MFCIVDISGQVLTAYSAKVAVTTTIVNTAASTAHAGARINVTLVEASTGEVAGTATTVKFPSLIPGSSSTTTVDITVASPKLWAARSPALYTVMAELFHGAQFTRLR